MLVYLEYCVLSSRGLCDELITRPEESCRLWCVVVCDTKTSWMMKPWPIGRLSRQNKERKWQLLWINYGQSYHSEVFARFCVITKNRENYGKFSAYSRCPLLSTQLLSEPFVSPDKHLTSYGRSACRRAHICSRGVGSIDVRYGNKVGNELLCITQTAQWWQHS